MKHLIISFLKSLVIVALWSVVATAHIQPDKALFLKISKTYGYNLGQDIALDRIEKRYPALASAVLLARSEYEVAFGSSMKKINTYMEKLMGKEWEEYKRTIEKRLSNMVAKQTMTRIQAEQFITLVRKRAKGEIDSPMLETMLLFKPGYDVHPEQEYIDGYRYIYTTGDSVKAKGVHLALTIPKTWKAKEGKRPNVVQDFVSPTGAMLMLMVKNMPLQAGEKITQNVVDEIIKSGQIKQFIPPGSTLLESNKIVIEGLPGYQLKYRATLQRVRSTITMEAMQYVVFYKNKMITIQGSNVVSVNGKNIEDGGIEKYEKLFDFVANSLVIKDLYR